MISQTAGSNANEIIEEIDKLTAEIAKELPKGLVLTDLMSTKDFLDASINEVVKTLLKPSSSLSSLCMSSCKVYVPPSFLLYPSSYH